MANSEAGSHLAEITHTPADDREIEDYAAGVVKDIMEYASRNVVASLLSRIRSDAEQLIELRKAATNAIKLIDDGYGSMAASLLRKALNPKQPEKEIR